MTTSIFVGTLYAWQALCAKAAELMLYCTAQFNASRREGLIERKKRERCDVEKPSPFALRRLQNGSSACPTYTEECLFLGKELRESDFWPRSSARAVHAIPCPTGTNLIA